MNNNNNMYNWIDSELPDDEIILNFNQKNSNNNKHKSFHINNSPPIPSFNKDEQYDYKQDELYNEINDDIIPMNNNILSVVYNKFKLGIAYYDTNLSILYLSECWEDDSFSCLAMVKQQVNPKTIIIPSRMSEKFIESVQKKEEGQTFTVHFSKSNDFTVENGKNKLLNIKLPIDSSSFSEKLLFLERIIDFNQLEMIKATGGLLNYLSKYLALDEYETLDSFKLNEIICFTFDSFLNIDTNSLYSLQIFSNENHPSCYSIGNSKEGLSVFGIINRTKSTIGKRKLKSWFMRPPRNRDIIEERYSLISHFNDSSNSLLTSSLLSCLSSIKDLHMNLNKLNISQNSDKYLINIYTSLQSFLRIVLILEQNSPTIPFLSKIFSLSGDQILKIIHIFENTYVSEDIITNQLRIKSGLDNQLDKLREVYDSMGNILTNCGEEEKSKFSGIKWITSFHFVYYPQLGCLICIPISSNYSISQQKNIQGLSFIFQTSQYIYFQNHKTKELDDYFGDIHNDILDIEGRIQRVVVEEVLSCSGDIIEVSNYCAELDAILSLAVASRELNFTRPFLNSENVISIKNGRHPLQELCTTTFIPNDTNLIDNKSIMLITGPNQSGKSIYLKQVGIIVYLAHVGCFVPAENANICLCDRIFTRISTRESNSISESSFMIDCKQIALMTKFSTSNSLLLIDEFGKGTNPQDGISLLYGLIIHYTLKNSPNIILSTHFYEIFKLISEKQAERISFNSMEFLIEKSMSNNNNLSFDSFIPLYKLVVSKSNCSFGLSCGHLAGISLDVLERAKVLIDHQEKYNTIDFHKLSSIKSTEYTKRLKYYNEIIESFANIEKKGTQQLLDKIKKR